MSKSAAMCLESDVVIFPMPSKQSTPPEIPVAEPVLLNIKTENQTVKTKVENRFARLKKSLRKRSVSIL